MTDRLAFLYPEMVLFITTCVVMVLGLSPTLAVRRGTALVAGLGLAAAAVLALVTTPGGNLVQPNAGQVLLPSLPAYAKVVSCVVGIGLLLMLAGTVDRAEEEDLAAGRRNFNALRFNRAEFYAFFLFSMTGLNLCASADDLIWLFLALELTSLPTYVMVTISTRRGRSQEAGVKYFFLGAIGAALFLYGFALIYGGTGSTNLNLIHSSITQNGLNGLTMAGMLLAIAGLAFKIAAVPMHFYTADVYQGSAPQVSAMLAFVPKTAGFIALLLLLATVGWRFAPGVDASGAWTTSPNADALPEPIRLMLWVMAALTMTVGNVLAVLQTSVKRILAYSSIAHSGYMLVGLIAGPGDQSFAQNGLAAVLFYLMVYGVMNIGVFAVLAALERPARRAGEDPEEVETIDDLRGLWRRRPVLAAVMGVSALSLLGLPPLLGFFGKVPLFTSAIAAGEITLVLILGINSAIAAFYYLRLVAAPILDEPEATLDTPSDAPFPTRRLAGVLSAVGVVALVGVGNTLMARAAAAGASVRGEPARTNPNLAPGITPEQDIGEDAEMAEEPAGDEPTDAPPADEPAPEGEAPAGEPAAAPSRG